MKLRKRNAENICLIPTEKGGMRMILVYEKSTGDMLGHFSPHISLYEIIKATTE